MNHMTAIRELMTSRYFLGELSEQEREEFEQHYFDCPECAADVRAAYTFTANAREVLSAPVVAEPAPRPLFGFWNWRFAPLAVLNFALLASFSYDSFWRIPELRRQLRRAETPQIAQEVMVPPGARGASAAVNVHVSGGMLEPVFDLPQRFESYSYEITGPSGGQKLNGNLAAPSDDQLKLIIPLAGLNPGSYVLLLHGRQGSTSQEIARLAFQVQP